MSTNSCMRFSIHGCRHESVNTVAHLTNSSVILHATLCEVRAVVVGITHKDSDIAGYPGGSKAIQQTITNKAILNSQTHGCTVGWHIQCSNSDRHSSSFPHTCTQPCKHTHSHIHPPTALRPHTLTRGCHQLPPQWWSALQHTSLCPAELDHSPWWLQCKSGWQRYPVKEQ